MKNITLAAFAVCIMIFDGSTAQAQWTNCSGNSVGNDCLGYSVLATNSGGYNAVFGNYSMHNNTSGIGNSALGFQALNQNTSGYWNTALGDLSLYSETTAQWNVAAGYQSLYNTATGWGNVGIGSFAGENITTGSNNIAIGLNAGYYNSTGNYNIEIGHQGLSTDSGVIRIGDNNQSSFYAAGINGVTVSGGIPVYINSSGQMGTVSSSIRFKEDVHDMGSISDGLMYLRPVIYRYKQPAPDGSKPIDYGLIAEEVAKIYPDLVVKDTSGQIQTVQYQKLTPMLLNELQKQHQLLQVQQAKIEQLEKKLAALPSLEQRLTALEAARPSSARLEAKLVTK